MIKKNNVKICLVSPELLNLKRVKEIQRVLKKNGCLIISTPNYPIKRFYDFYNALIYFKYKRVFDDPTHISPYSFKELKNKLKSVSINVTKLSSKGKRLNLTRKEMEKKANKLKK